MSKIAHAQGQLSRLWADSNKGGILTGLLDRTNKSPLKLTVRIIISVRVSIQASASNESTLSLLPTLKTREHSPTSTLSYGKSRGRSESPATVTLDPQVEEFSLITPLPKSRPQEESIDGTASSMSIEIGRRAGSPLQEYETTSMVDNSGFDYMDGVMSDTDVNPW